MSNVIPTEAMTIFCPSVERMLDPVLTLCPQCGRSHSLATLTDDEKQFLLDSTSFHELFTELGLLKVVDQLIRNFPGTKNRLIVSKMKEVGRGADDPLAVERTIATTPGLEDLLAHSSFLFPARFHFVAKAVGANQARMLEPLVTCTDCESQYQILDSEYYMACG
tara:strand:+ start:1704 stop:2198 length:495 start_codon:yes stop_codon:yes gene_type:complete